MQSFWKLEMCHISTLCMIILLTCQNVQTSKIESSAEYLQNAIMELQEMNLPQRYQEISLPQIQKIDNEIGVNTDYKLVYRNDQPTSHKTYRNDNNNRQDLQQYEQDAFGNFALSSVTTTQFHQMPPPSPIISVSKEPEVMGLTRATLAEMYRNALQKGAAVSLSSLTNALSTGNSPQVLGSHLELPVTQQPMYQYYFFPLKTFVSELNKDNGYNLITAAQNQIETSKESQNQLSNPLFMAISTFISMALLLMMGILFLPKLADFNIYPRGIQDNFRFANFDFDSFEQRNFFRNFDEYRLD